MIYEEFYAVKGLVICTQQAAGVIPLRMFVQLLLVIHILLTDVTQYMRTLVIMLLHLCFSVERQLARKLVLSGLQAGSTRYNTGHHWIQVVPKTRAWCHGSLKAYDVGA